MIEFEDVVLVLNHRKILDGLSFTIDQGESILLAGNSGAGKSTILKLILGLLRPTDGKIRIEGQDIISLSEAELMDVRQQFGIVFQEGALFDSLTVEENVGFFLKENLNLTEAEVHRRVIKELKFLGLENFAHYYPAQLSGGMKKRVAVARAVVSHPKGMLYDEPTAGLDPRTARRVVQLIRQLQVEFSMTSLVVTHELPYFVNDCERMIMLQNGKVVYDGIPISDIYEDEKPGYSKVAV